MQQGPAHRAHHRRPAERQGGAYPDMTGAPVTKRTNQGRSEDGGQCRARGIGGCATKTVNENRYEEEATATTEHGDQKTEHDTAPESERDD